MKYVKFEKNFSTQKTKRSFSAKYWLIGLISLLLISSVWGLGGTVTPTCTYSSSSVQDKYLDDDGIFTVQVVTNINTTNSSSILTINNRAFTETFNADPLVNTTTWSISENQLPDGSYSYAPILSFTNETLEGNVTLLSVTCPSRQIVIDTGNTKPLVVQNGEVMTQQQAILNEVESSKNTGMLILLGVIGLVAYLIYKRR